MCFQLNEVYGGCRCPYYQHAIDRCAAFSKPGHEVIKRTVLVGYACSEHAGVFLYRNTTAAKRNHSTDANECSVVTTSVRTDDDSEPERPARRRNRTSRIDRDVDPASTGRTSIDYITSRNERQAQPLKFNSGIFKVPNDSIHPKAEAEQDEEASAAQDSAASNSYWGFKSHLPSETTKSAWQSKGSDITHLCLDEDEMRDSSESELSETESVLSTTSSATTVDIDALEAIFRRLLQHHELRFLWPQVVRRSQSRQRSLRNIERFLRRYAEDLHKLATNVVSEEITINPIKQVQLDACRFLRRSRLNLAQRIFEAHYQLCQADSFPEEAGAKATRQQNDVVDDSDDDADNSDFDPVYMVAESFLFETEPIDYLATNLKAFVKLPQPKQTSDKLQDSIKIYFENAMMSLRKPPLMEGKKRATWTCKCGRRLYDDFVELRPGAVADLELELRKNNAEHRTFNDLTDASDITQQSTDTQGKLIHLWNGIQVVCSSLTQRKLPQQTLKRGQDLELGLCPSALGEMEKDHNFLLLCVPFQRYATKLHQAEVCRINSDQELFRVLRHYYFTQRGRSTWTRLRKVCGIEFSMFEVYRSQLVDVKNSPSLPSNAHTQYTYEPMPAEIMPPIGSNHLMHLFEHPEDADVLPVLYRKVPKKLIAKLEACPRKGSSAGWGLQYVEGMNWFVVFVYGCAGFGMALLAAVVWAATRADVQGAFAIAGFMIAFLLFCGGIARAEIHI